MIGQASASRVVQDFAPGVNALASQLQTVPLPSFPGTEVSPLTSLNDPEFFGPQNAANITATTNSPIQNNVVNG